MLWQVFLKKKESNNYTLFYNSTCIFLKVHTGHVGRLSAVILCETLCLIVKLFEFCYFGSMAYCCWCQKDVKIVTPH